MLTQTPVMLLTQAAKEAICGYMETSLKYYKPNSKKHFIVIHIKVFLVTVYQHSAV